MALLLLLCLTLLLPQPPARADGCFVWRNRAIDVLEPEQKALIYYDQGREDLVLSVKFTGAPEEFGWIVPLPSVPEIFAEDSLLFRLLSQQTQRRWSDRSERGRMLYRTMGVETVLSRRVGIYDAKVVEASTGKDLRGWLSSHGYRVPPEGERVLDRYIRKGWVFATLRIAPPVAAGSPVVQ